jgi:hypothetical protein
MCTKLNSDLDGGQILLDLITVKMQSPQEWEALIAFYVVLIFRTSQFVKKKLIIWSFYTKKGSGSVCQKLR